MAEQSCRRNDSLVRKAITAAKIKNDSWNLLQFQKLLGRKLSVADRECLQQYVDNATNVR